MKPHQLAPLILISFSAALITRFSAAYGATLPIGDGGLWLVIAQSILDNNFNLPTSIFFNGEITPFCYPPLAGYMIALLHSFWGTSIIELIALAPPILNLAAVLCFCYFACAAIRDQTVLAIAILIFPLTIQSYDIFIAGGGVSRNLGLIFQLLAWSFALRQRVAAAGIVNGLAILSHPTGGLWSSLGILVFFAIDKRISLREFLLITLISALLIAPWLTIAINANGLTPFFLAFAVSGNEMFTWRLFGTPERLILPGQFLGALALIGLIKTANDRQLFAPALFLITLAIDHR